MTLVCAWCTSVLILECVDDSTPVYQRCPQCDGPMGPMDDLLADLTPKGDSAT